jgi:hypothetical protein
MKTKRDGIITMDRLNYGCSMEQAADRPRKRSSKSVGEPSVTGVGRPAFLFVGCNLQAHRLSANRTFQHPRVGEQNAIEHAMQIMDRYNQLFVRKMWQQRCSNSRPLDSPDAHCAAFIALNFWLPPCSSANIAAS